MKAALKASASESYFKTDVYTDDGIELNGLDGASLSPRGVTLHCTPEQIDTFNYGVDREQQTKYRSVMLNLNLHFGSESIQLETKADVHSICRRSQTCYEVNLVFKDMMQDGYKHIARYVVESSSNH